MTQIVSGPEAETRPPGPPGPDPRPAPTPLWLPSDEMTVRRHTAGRPPDAVSGWTTPSRVVRWLTPAGWRTRITRWGLVVAVVVLVTALPRLAGTSGWGNLARVAGYHWFALAWLLAVSVTIRAVRVRQ